MAITPEQIRTVALILHSADHPFTRFGELGNAAQEAAQRKARRVLEHAVDFEGLGLVQIR